MSTFSTTNEKRYLVRVDGDGVILTRNPATGNQAIIEMILSPSIAEPDGHNLTGLDGAPDSSTPIIFHDLLADYDGSTGSEALVYMKVDNIRFGQTGYNAEGPLWEKAGESAYGVNTKGHPYEGGTVDDEPLSDTMDDAATAAHALNQYGYNHSSHYHGWSVWQGNYSTGAITACPFLDVNSNGDIYIKDDPAGHSSSNFGAIRNLRDSNGDRLDYGWLDRDEIAAGDRMPVVCLWQPDRDVIIQQISDGGSGIRGVGELVNDGWNTPDDIHGSIDERNHQYFHQQWLQINKADLGSYTNLKAGDGFMISEYANGSTPNSNNMYVISAVEFVGTNTIKLWLWDYNNGKIDGDYFTNAGYKSPTQTELHLLKSGSGHGKIHIFEDDGTADNDPSGFPYAASESAQSVQIQDAQLLGIGVDPADVPSGRNWQLLCHFSAGTGSHQLKYTEPEEWNITRRNKPSRLAVYSETKVFTAHSQSGSVPDKTKRINTHGATSGPESLPITTSQKMNSSVPSWGSKGHISVIDPNRFNPATDDYVVVASGQTEFTGSDMTKTGAHATLAMDRDYGYLYFSHMPNTTPAPFAATGSASGCVVSFNATSLGGNTQVTARLFDSNGVQAKDSDGNPIPDETFSGTGSVNFDGLIPAGANYDIPSSNLNGTYQIKFTAGATYTGTVIHTISSVTVNGCRYIEFVPYNPSSPSGTSQQTSQSNYPEHCHLSIVMTNPHGITDVKTRAFEKYQDPTSSSGPGFVTDVNGAVIELTTAVNNGSPSHSSHLSIASAAASWKCMNEYAIAIIDVTGMNSSQSTAAATPLRFQNANAGGFQAGTIAWNPTICTGQWGFATTSSPNGCGIAAQVDSDIRNCLPYNCVSSGGIQRIKAEFWTTVGTPAKQAEVALEVTPVSGTWSPLTGFNWSASTAGTYQVRWFYEKSTGSGSSCSDSWVDFGSTFYDSVTISSCQSASLGSVTANGCGLNILVTASGYSSGELYAKVMQVGGSQIGGNTTFPLNNHDGSTVNAITFPSGTCNGSYNVTLTDSSGNTISGTTTSSNVSVTACAISIGTTVAQSNCEITGQVDSLTCVPTMTGSSDTQIKAAFYKNTGSGMAHISGSDVIKTITPSTSFPETGFNLTGTDVTNHPFEVRWYYNSGTSGIGANWVSLTNDTDSLTVNTCKTFSGSATASTNPKCAIDITVDWSATSSLGSTIRAVVFVDTNGNGVLDSSEVVVTGASVGGSTINFSSTGVNFTAGSGTETKTVVLDNVTTPNAMYIVEFQADPDGDTTFSPLNSGTIGLSNSDTHKSVTVNNCTVCADNSTPHYIQVDSSGNIITTNAGGSTRAMLRCSDDNPVNFAANGYCSAVASEITIYGTGTDAGWTTKAAACSAGTADATSITARLYGASSTAGQPLTPLIGSGFTGNLQAGFYIICSTTTPNSNADPCTGTSYAFQVDSSGKIVSTHSGKAASFSGTYASQTGQHQWGSTGVCYSGGTSTSFTYEPLAHAGESIARSSLGCGDNDGATAYLFGNASGDLYVHTADDNTSSKLSAGWYTSCEAPKDGAAACGASATEYFIEITSTNGDWDGKLYGCNGSSVLRVDATVNDWFEESPIVGWTGSATGQGWTGSSPTGAGACNLCPAQYVNVNTGNNTLYVSGTLENHTQDSDRLRIYRGADKTQPLVTGWYRFCGNPPTLVVNGVPEYREKFNCYGNPFSWFSAKPRSSMVLDEHNNLTNGVQGRFWVDAPIKDLTNTNNDLGIYGWHEVGDASQVAILRGTIATSSCTPTSRDVLKFTAANKANLTRTGTSYHTDANGTIPTIRSVKTTATEVTIAFVVDTETNGEVLRLVDMVGSDSGSWEAMSKQAESGTTVTESWIVVSKESSGLNLQTGKRSLVWDSATEQATWGTTTQSPALHAAISGWSVVVVTISEEGHSIRVNGALVNQNTQSSYFCEGIVGITNLSTNIGGHQNYGGNHITMDFGEMIVYDEQLNTDEVQELEGYLRDKWCVTLSDSNHPYHSSAPECNKCETDCCESEVTISTSVSSNVVVTANYKCSESVFGYQFKLSGLSGLGIDAGMYTGAITASGGKTFSVAFTDPLARGFRNYLSVDGNNDVWVIGHFYDGGSGDFNKVLPPATSSTEFLKITITETTGSPSQNWSGITATLVTSSAKINHPAAPHPVLATYYHNINSKQRTPVNFFNGDSTGDGTVGMTDVEAIVTRISLSHAAGAWDLSATGSTANSWMHTLDANGKGWLDVCDAVTTLLMLKRYGSGGGSGTPISASASVSSASTPKNLLSQPACTNELVPTECEPCPCPEQAEPEDCISKVWIESVTPLKRDESIGVVTVRYQSSCCIDGYSIELGGYDPSKIGTSSTHDGVVYIPSMVIPINNALDIGQGVTETHKRFWMQGSTLDPTYSGDIVDGGVIASLFMFHTGQALGQPTFLNQIDEKLNFPIVWGMTNSNLTSALAGQTKNLNSNTNWEGRVGFDCIPPTCNGESKILTKFLVNMNSFRAMPYVKKFRLVTNDNPRTPISFDSGSGITWTGDGADTDTTVDNTDWTEVLLYLYTGWSRTTTWSDSNVQATVRAAVDKFNSENDNNHLDIVDALTVNNHMLLKGEDDTDTSAYVVPTDCCPCDLPTAFTITPTQIPCDCSEEGFVSGKGGQVTLTWTTSTNAKSYEIYRQAGDEMLSNENGIQNSAAEMEEAWLVNSLWMKSGRRSTRELSTQQYEQVLSVMAQKKERRGKWQHVASLDGSATSWIDSSPPSFGNCCPDSVLPKTEYMIVAKNDCGEVSSVTEYRPKCCNPGPTANNVTLDDKISNQKVSFMVDAYHPNAPHPFGGLAKAATAQVTFTDVPADDVTLKLIDFKGTVHTFKFKSGGGSATDTTFIDTSTANTVSLLRDALISGLASSPLKITGVAGSGGIVDMTQNDGDNTSDSEFTRCGNTKITVSSTAAITIPASGKFEGGNMPCVSGVPGYPHSCEKLKFEIVGIKYSGVIGSERGKFVGATDFGTEYPMPNYTGKFEWIPPLDYIGDVTFDYIVTNERGCVAGAKINVRYNPLEVKLNCFSPPCGDVNYGYAQLWWELPKGVTGTVRVMRKLSTDATPWDTTSSSPQVLLDGDGNKVEFSLAGHGDEPFRFTDVTATLPDKCCSDDIIYHYVLVICQSNGYVLTVQDPFGNEQYKEEQSGATEYCTLSTVCYVTIPCCPAPHNPIPKVCVSDCDGTAAETSFVFHSTDFDTVNGGTISIIDAAGTTVQYTIKNDGSAVAGNQQFNAGGSRAIAADNLATLIESADGHNGTIHAYDSAGRRVGHTSEDFSDGKVVLKQVAVGNLGNTDITTGNNFDNTTSINATGFICGFDADKHAQAYVYWSGNVSSDNVIGYDVYRREKGTVMFIKQNQSIISATESQNNQNWEHGKFFYLDEDLYTLEICGYGVNYEYAVIAINDRGDASGNPDDANWGSWVSSSANQGDPCSPGGTTIEVTILDCPPTPCVEEKNITICAGEESTIDVSELIDCIPRKPDQTLVDIVYSIVSTAAWITASIDGATGVISYTTHNVDFDTVGAGPHNGAIVWRATINESACPSQTNGNINITLEDCGCPCPQDEKDYTICDVNFDNAEYIGNGASIASIAGKLVNTDSQIPFSLSREGGQNLRKGQPYVVSKGKIDCD